MRKPRVVVPIRPELTELSKTADAIRDPLLNDIFQLLESALPIDKDGYPPRVESSFTLDEQAMIDDEDAFRKRYHVSFGRRHREAAIRLKKERDITEQDLFDLIHSNAIVRRRSGIVVRANLFFETLGWVQVLVLSGFGLLLFFALQRIAGIDSFVILVLLTLASALLIWITYYIYIRPSAILRRSR